MTKTYTQADLDAAVAAALEKVAGMAMAGKLDLKAVTCANQIRALIPTDATDVLAERDAKVRADTLREAQLVVHRECGKVRHVLLGDKIALEIEALIEGEA